MAQIGVSVTCMYAQAIQWLWSKACQKMVHHKAPSTAIMCHFSLLILQGYKTSTCSEARTEAIQHKLMRSCRGIAAMLQLRKVKTADTACTLCSCSSACMSPSRSMYSAQSKLVWHPLVRLSRGLGKITVADRTYKTAGPTAAARSKTHGEWRTDVPGRQ